jgi:hypothetical protein
VSVKNPILDSPAAGAGNAPLAVLLPYQQRFIQQLAELGSREVVFVPGRLNGKSWFNQQVKKHFEGVA